MNFLIIYPMQPNRFWSFEYVLKFISMTEGLQPRILLNIASMLPKEWNKRLVDMNASDLNDVDILWADYVFINAMAIQKKSAFKLIERCKKLKAKIVAAGPLFNSNSEYHRNVDHLILNDTEITFPHFLNDLYEGKTKQKYSAEDYVNTANTVYSN